jgi:PEP-CTERM motif
MKFVKRILGAAIGGTMLIGLCAPSAEAGYVVDLTQEGADVVATGSGAIALTGLTFVAAYPNLPQIIPVSGFILTGDAPAREIYSGATGPASFGSGSATAPSSASGVNVGIGINVGIGNLGGGDVEVPYGYVSDSALSSSATWDNATFSSLGVTPGTYKWTWGSGANQSFTLVIGTAVPEPSTWAMLVLGFAGLAWAGWRGGRVVRTVRSA